MDSAFKFISIVESIVFSGDAGDQVIFQKKQDAARCVSKVRQLSLPVIVLPDGDTAKMSNCSSQKSRPMDSLAPVMLRILTGPISEDDGDSLKGKPRKEIESGFFCIILYSYLSHVRWFDASFVSASSHGRLM